MHEVEMRVAGDAAEPRVRPLQAYFVPPGVWHAHRAAQPAHDAPRETEARRRRILLAAFEEELHAHAEAEERDAAGMGVAHRGVEAAGPQLARAVTEVADARQHDRARAADDRRIVADPHVGRAGAAHRALDVREVAD